MAFGRVTVRLSVMGRSGAVSTGAGADADAGSLPEPSNEP